MADLVAVSSPDGHHRLYRLNMCWLKNVCANAACMHFNMHVTETMSDSFAVVKCIAYSLLQPSAATRAFNVVMK